MPFCVCVEFSLARMVLFYMSDKYAYKKGKLQKISQLSKVLRILLFFSLFPLFICKIIVKPLSNYKKNCLEGIYLFSQESISSKGAWSCHIWKLASLCRFLFLFIFLIVMLENVRLKLAKYGSSELLGNLIFTLPNFQANAIDTWTSIN